MNSEIRSLMADLTNITARQPDKTALLDNHGRTLNYRALLDQIEQRHRWLKTCGLEGGDALIALMPNAIETAILFLASLRGGYTYVPMPCTATFTEVSRWKNLTHARLCIVANPVNLSLLEQVKQLDWQVKTIDIDGKITERIGKCVEAQSGGRIVIPSSGSTGEPKAILLDADRLWSAGVAFLRYHQIENADVRFWNYLPMSYLGGLFNLILIPLAASGSVFIDEAFNGKTFLLFWPTVERFQINSLWLVPTILRGLISLSKHVSKAVPHPHLKYCYLGTAPVSLEEKERFCDVFGIQPLENYGLSETTFISSEHIQTLALRSQGSVGTIMPYVDVKFVPVTDDDRSVTEIWVRTPYRMLGYLDAHGMIEPSQDAEGFLPTGDFGQIVNGQLKLSGRSRDIIKKGGILVALREIELLAESYPSVAEATAVSIKHAFYGESYILYVRTEKPVSDHEAFISGLTAWLHGQFTRHKWPERVIYCDDFPRTASGKIQKHLLVERSAAYAQPCHNN